MLSMISCGRLASVVLIVLGLARVRVVENFLVRKHFVMILVRLTLLLIMSILGFRDIRIF